MCTTRAACRFALAQGDSAVSMAQTEAIEWDENEEEAWHDTNVLSKDWNAPESSIWDLVEPDDGD